jgi:hypothetical protein
MAGAETPDQGLFNSIEVQQMRQEDSHAWWSVCGLLICVAGGGVLLMALTVLWIAVQ